MALSRMSALATIVTFVVRVVCTTEVSTVTRTRLYISDVYKRQASADAMGEKYDIFSSFGYLNEKGYIIGSDYDRFTARLKANYLRM